MASTGISFGCLKFYMYFLGEFCFFFEKTGFVFEGVVALVVFVCKNWEIRVFQSFEGLPSLCISLILLCYCSFLALKDFLIVKF